MHPASAQMCALVHSLAVVLQPRHWLKAPITAQVMLLNPRDQGRAAMLLQGGGIMGRRFQPYESHIPYLLQFKVCRPARLPSAAVGPMPPDARQHMAAVAMRSASVFTHC